MSGSRRATRKDVLYALEFGGERLVKTIIVGGGRNPDHWSLSASGMEVDPKTAREVCDDPRVIPAEDGLFPGMSQSFGWRKDAA